MLLREKVIFEFYMYRTHFNCSDVDLIGEELVNDGPDFEMTSKFIAKQSQE